MTRIPVILDSDLVEHAAVYAAERGDTALESLCDDALASGDADVVLAVIREDRELQEWMMRPSRRRSV